MSNEKEVNDVNESTNAVNKKFTNFISKHLLDLFVIFLIIVGSIVLYMVI